MIKTPQELKPFLLHSDFFVRRAVTDYFHDGRIPDDDIAPLILEGLDRFGYDEQRRGLWHLSDFTINESTLDALIRRIPTVATEQLRSDLLEAVLQSPGALLRRRAAAVTKLLKEDEPRRRRLRRVFDLAETPSDVIWNNLLFLVNDCGMLEVSEEAYEHADAMIVEVGRRDFPSNEAVLEALTNSNAEQRFRYWIAVDLAGRRRISEAGPLLVKQLGDNVEDSTELIIEVLPRIGGREICLELERRLLDRRGVPDHLRFEAAMALGNVKHPESERIVLELIDREKDQEILAWLGCSLCDLFSDQALVAVRKLLEKGYDERITNLRHHVIAVMTVYGQDAREMKEWKASREAETRRLRAFEEEVLNPAEDEDEDEQEGTKHPGLRIDRSASPAPIPPISPPIRKQSARVGRNDPCPCGSGKKYKKCHGIG